MATTLYLPKADNPNIGNPKVQQWVSMPENGADELANKLGIPEKLLESQIIGAIPTPWARMLIFEQALFNDRHPLHHSILQEWRGLLACFCYRSYAGFKFNVEQIDLADLRPDGRDSKVSVAFKLAKPDASPNWDRFDLIYIDEFVVGAASPRTIVFCTAEELQLPNVPWRRNGRFIDPLKYYTSMEDRKLLAYWLTAAISKITDSSLNLPNKGRIVTLLEAWKNETGIARTETVSYTEFPDLPLALLPLAPEVDIPDAAQVRSDVMLKVTKPIPKSPLLVSEAILKDDVRRIYQGVRGSKQLAALLPKGLRGEKFSSEIPYPWLNPEVLFTEVLIQVETLNGDRTEFLQPANDKRTFLIPLKKEILDYFNPSELARLVEIRPSGRNVQITLRLPNTTSRKPEEFSRIYSNPVAFYNVKGQPESGAIIQITDPPVMELWPNFIHAEWKKHYLFIAQQGSEGSSESLEFELYPHSPEPPHRRKKTTASSSAITLEHVWEIKKIPEALIFHFHGQAGILPVRQPAPLESKAAPKPYVVAVDFGQSHSTAFWAPPDAKTGDKCEPVIFAARNIPLTNVDEDTRDLVLRGGFFPKTMIATSLDSSIISPAKVLDGNKGIVNGAIYFPDIGQKYAEGEKNRISAGLKWADAVGDREKVTVFLEQLVTMIEAEALASGKRIVEYRWAYPQAFSRDIITTFSDRWAALQHDYHARTTSKKTESMAICQFLVGTSEEAVVRGNSIFGIDIGGSTTDIGVWAEDKMQISDSCRLAGWTLSRLLFKNQKIGETIVDLLQRRVQKDVGKKILSGDDEHHIAMYWNRLLRALAEDPDRAFEKFVAEVRASGNEHCRLVTTMAVAMISMMVFYAGILAGSWHKQKRKPLPGNTPRLFFTGNGGNLLIWLPGGASMYNEVFLPIFAAGYSICSEKMPEAWRTIHIEKPSRPKQEVAIGLLLERETLVDNAANFTTTADNGLKLEKVEMEPAKPLTEKEFAALEVPTGWRSQSLKTFVDTFNKTSKAAGLSLKNLPDPDLIGGIGDEVRERVANWSRRLPSRRKNT
jgi:hypothetical protein